MAVKTGWGLVDPWSNTLAHPTWIKKQVETFMPYKYLTRRWYNSAYYDRRHMRALHKMQQGAEATQALTLIPAHKWHMLGVTPDIPGEGYCDPQTAAAFSQWWHTQRGDNNIIVGGFDIGKDSGFAWANHYMSYGGWFGSVLHVRCYVGSDTPFWYRYGLLCDWMDSNNIQASVIISAVNCPPGSELSDRIGLMEACRAGLDDGRLHQVYWMMTYTHGTEYEETLFNGLTLMNDDQSLTHLGEMWIDIGQV